MSIYYNNQITEINNEELYYEGLDSVNKSLEISKSINKTIDEKYNIFVYWIGNNINYKQSVVVKSFLATQNLKNTTLKIYSDEKISDNPVFDRYREFEQVEFHIFNLKEEIKGTQYENNFKYVDEIIEHKFNAPYESDFFRLLMLNKYGGFYIDFDVLLLRDLSPLLKYDFLYQWGSYPNNMINGAIMQLKKDSVVNDEMTKNLLNSNARPGSGSLHWASDLYVDVKSSNPELVIFPAAFFNPEWQSNCHVKIDYLLEPMKMHDYSNMMYDGSFTWHWHNRWNEPIEIDSKFDILDKKLENDFIKKFYN